MDSKLVTTDNTSKNSEKNIFWLKSHFLSTHQAERIWGWMVKRLHGEYVQHLLSPLALSS